MKKYSIIQFIVSGMLMLLLIPSFHIVTSTNIKFSKELYYEIVTKLDDPPEWAEGEFNGTYGKIVLGKPSVELGWARGF